MKQKATTLNCSFFLLIKLKTYRLFSIFIFFKINLIKERFITYLQQSILKNKNGNLAIPFNRSS